jgi:hypothetical protein
MLRIGEDARPPSQSSKVCRFLVLFSAADMKVQANSAIMDMGTTHEDARESGRREISFPEQGYVSSDLHPQGVHASSSTRARVPGVI